MTLAGHIDQIEGDKVWVLVSPEGVGCGSQCTCEKPVRRVETRAAGQASFEKGEMVVVTTKRAAGRGLLLVLLAVLGGTLGYFISASMTKEAQAGITILGTAIVGILGAFILSAFRKHNFPETRKIQVQLH